MVIRSKLEQQEIANKIASLTIAGFTITQIKKFLKDNYSISSSRTVTKYTTQARRIISEIAQKDLETYRNEAIARYYRLLQLAEQLKDYKTVLAIQTRLDKITGVETLIIKQNVTFTNEEIQKFVKKLIDA